MQLCENCTHFGAQFPKPACHLKKPKTWFYPTDNFDRSYGYRPDRTTCFQPKHHAQPEPAADRPSPKRSRGGGHPRQ